MLKQTSKITKKVFIRLFPLLVKVSGQLNSMFVSLEKFQLTLHVLKRSLHFHFTTTILKLFNVVIYREYNLV